MSTRHYRDYSEDDKAAVLAHYEACGVIRKTARAFSIPECTLRKWLRGEGVSNVTADSVRAQKRALADEFEAIAYKACELAPGKIEEASFAQVMTGAGIAVDKMRLLREKSTSILGGDWVEPKTVEERDAMVIEIFERARKRLEEQKSRAVDHGGEV
jgi:transposase-like protein